MTRSIAVILTTYNAPDYLAKVLHGYICQSRLPDELIVADDGSDRRTADLVNSFSKLASFPVSHVWQEDLGFRAAAIRNKAVIASSSDYLVFTDGDCVPHPCFVADHLRLATHGWFIQGKRMLLAEDVSLEFTFPGFAGLLALAVKGRLSGLHHLLRVPGFAPEKTGLRGIKTCNFALFRDDLLAVNGFNEDFVGWGREDAELAARLFKSGLRRKDPLFSAMVFHLWHPGNSRATLAENDRMLDEAVSASGHYCKNGINRIS